MTIVSEEMGEINPYFSIIICNNPNNVYVRWFLKPFLVVNFVVIVIAFIFKVVFKCV